MPHSENESLRSIAVIDRDPEERRLLALRLEREGYRVVEADPADSPPPADVVLIEVSDPGGLDRILSLRTSAASPVIALLDSPSIVAADVLDVGVEDVVVKPFTVRELVARIRGVVRRLPELARDDTLAFDGLRISVGERRVEVAGEAVDFPAREFDLLLHLASAPGQVFTREQLLDAVWESNGEWQHASTVTEHVRRIRKRLGADHPDRWIETVHSVGYRFRREPTP